MSSARPDRSAPHVGVVDQGTEKTAHYVALVEEAGGRPTVLRWCDERDPLADAVEFHALVLCGGDDVDGRHFGQVTHPAADLDDERRALYEIALCRAALHVQLPLLAVCRGMQVLNIAAGGDIEQHIPDVPGRAEHRDGILHALRTARGSWIERLGANGGAPPTVNSFHHQAVGRVADPLRTTAWSLDGSVEALEGPGDFCVGVQWHPEREGNDGLLGAGLFAALLDAARAG